MEQSDPWYFTVVRTQGMRLMRPEKAWRPIITVEIDRHHRHETIMGVDGQNPNLKERFELHEVHNASRVDIQVWHRSQSKKKAKKRNLVASASHTLGEIVRQQAKEPRKEVELRLQCQSATKRAISSRGRPQNGAAILIKIHSPANTKQELLELVDDSWEAESSGLGAVSSANDSELPSMPPSPTNDVWPGSNGALTTLRRRRRGYRINSDEEIYSDKGDDASQLPIFSDGSSYHSDDDDGFHDDSTLRDDDRIFIRGPSVTTASGPREWIHAIWPSLLPQYTERIEVPPDMTLAERVLASFTTYNELKNARLDSQYEKVFERLQTEWTYVGGLLVALAAVNSAVFAIGPDAIFDVQSYARSAIAASSICSGLGIACDAWFLLRYNWADLHTFINRARDVYSSYFFFALSARVPALCLFFSAVTLMIFMGLIAFEVWPTGVLLTCFVIGLVMTLQFLVFGAHWCALRIVGVVRWVVRLCSRVLGAEKHTGTGTGTDSEMVKGSVGTAG